MKLNEIKKAVDAGITVKWSNDGYDVRGSNGVYLITFHTGNTIGLHGIGEHAETMNGKPEEFYTLRPCKLYTLDGIKDAVAKNNGEDKTALISAVDGTFSMQVMRGMAEHKFDQETIPTFYAC